MITLTEKAAQEVARVITETMKLDQTTTALKVSVSGGGCSGFTYGLAFAQLDELEPAVFSIKEFHGVQVAVDKKSDLFLDGTTIDFYDGIEKRGFTFNNPQAKNSCGCGSSFNA